MVYSGGHLAVLKVSSLKQCVDACADTPRCSRVTAFPNKNKCLLKSSDSYKSSTNTRTSSSVSVCMKCVGKDQGDKCHEANTDYPEGTIKEVEECQEVV